MNYIIALTAFGCAMSYLAGYYSDDVILTVRYFATAIINLIICMSALIVLRLEKK